MKPALTRKFNFKTFSNEFMNAAKFASIQGKNNDFYLMMNLDKQQKIQLYRLNQSDEFEILLEAKGYLYTYQESGLALESLCLIDEEGSIISCLASVKPRDIQSEAFEFVIVEFNLLKNEVQYIQLGKSLDEPKRLKRFQNGDYLLSGIKREYSPTYFSGVAPIEIIDYVFRINSTGVCQWCKRKKRKKVFVKSSDWAEKEEWYFRREHEIIDLTVLNNQMILIEEWKNENTRDYIAINGKGEYLQTILSLPAFDFFINFIPQQSGCRIYTSIKNIDTSSEYRYQLRETIFNEKMACIGENIINELSTDLWIKAIFSSNDIITAELLKNRNVIRIGKYVNGIWEKFDFTVSGISMILQVVYQENTETFFLLVSTEKNYSYKVLGISKTKGIFWKHSFRATEDCNLYLSGTRLIIVQIQHDCGVKIELIHFE